MTLAQAETGGIRPLNSMTDSMIDSSRMNAPGRVPTCISSRHLRVTDPMIKNMRKILAIRLLNIFTDFLIVVFKSKSQTFNAGFRIIPHQAMISGMTKEVGLIACFALSPRHRLP